jgi:hypothetical protein
MASFYDLDYIIQINEKRLEEYSQAYQKNLDKFTNILVIYSGFGLFLIPIIQMLYVSETNCNFIIHICFILFIVLFLISLVNTIRLIIPVNIAYLQEPKRYYEEYLIGYENDGYTKEQAENLLKASYINELEHAAGINNKVFKRKGIFHYRALVTAMFAIVPYISCLGYQISIKDDAVQKVEIINKNLNFNENSNMADDKSKPKPAASTSTTPTPTPTKLPGVDSSQVRPSQPQLVKENFNLQNRQTKDSQKK